MERTTFLEHVRQSRLLTAAQLTDFLGSVPADAEAQALAYALVEQNLLTRYQARQLWTGHSKGLVLGQYRVLEELGKGGFGQVFKALHTMMDRVVAIKVISPELVQDERARLWFRREVLACTQLHHPNIVMAYDANEVEDVLFLAMEYVDGPNLESWVKANGPLPVPLACAMMRQSALALGHAHDRGMVHRDIKPANLLIPQLGLAATLAGTGASSRDAPVLIKVADFGLARLQRTSMAGTLMLQNEKSFVGTPDYVSPEQARDLHSVDIRSDLYSLGCTFYYTLTARRPFQGKTVLETIVQHLERDPEPLEDVRTDIPAALLAIIRRLMAKDPSQRFPTPAELVDALTPLCAAAMPLGLAEAIRYPAADAVAGGVSTQKPRDPDENRVTNIVADLAFWCGAASAAPPCTDTPLTSAQPTPLPANRPADAHAAAEMPATMVVQEAGLYSRPQSWEPAALAAPGPPPVLLRVASPAAAETEEDLSLPAVEQPFVADAALCQCWGQWLQVVEALVNRRRVRVDEQAFRTVRAAILEYCRSPIGQRPALLERLESLVEPWLTPHSLAQMDAQSLQSLWLRCCQLDLDLRGADRGGFWRMLGLLLAIMAVIGVGWFAWQHFQLSPRVQPLLDGLWSAYTAHPLMFLACALPVVVVMVSILALSRLLRS